MSSKKKSARSDRFVRKTLTIPADVISFGDQQAAKPEHAGNWSSYVRSLIIADHAKHQRQAA
jgi:hypothetical protein